MFALFAAGAGPQKSGNDLVHAYLMTDADAIVPGKSITLGIVFDIEPGWHTYWLNPGDSGMPTKIELKLPEGFTASPVRWPTPIRFDQAGDIVGYGYKGRAVYVTTITPPKDFAQSSATFGAKLKWLVCEDVCLPGAAEVKIELPVRPAAVARNEDVFAEARAALPSTSVDSRSGLVQSGEELIHQTFKADGAAEGTLSIGLHWIGTAGQLVDWFPPASQTVVFGKSQFVSKGQDFELRTSFNVLAGESPEVGPMTGVVAYTDSAGKRRGLEITFTFPSMPATQPTTQK